MKICKLKLKNLNSFRDPVEIDFEKPLLDDASLVAITGPTGSGKTTLLDAICVALYGRTPRLSGTGSQNPNHLISHGEKEAFAEVLFMANGTRYLATWSIRQKGTPKVQLFYADDGKLISDKLSTRGKSLGSSQNTVSEEVESILGLDFDAFRRSVMLAQGEFAAFLKASNEDRRTILEATAGVSIYDVLKQTLNDKVSEVEAANAGVYDKLNKIPEASHEQLVDAEAELDRLQTENNALGAESQQIQQEKDRETKRTDDFEKLQSSKKRQEELTDQQPEINVFQAELENANRAQRLLPEKQAFDTATSELESADEVFRVATAEKTAAQKQVEVDQVDFDAKETVYQGASAERDRKVEVYTAAKLNVQRAEERFAEAKKRDPDLANLDKQIDALESELTEKQTEQTQFQEQIDEAQTFLDANHLPTNSPQRLNDATGLQVELTTYQKQLETASASKSQQKKKASSLKRKIEELSKTREEQLAEKAAASLILKDASDVLNTLLTTGTLSEWNIRKQQAVKAQPISQKYEAVENDLADSENQLSGLMETETRLDAELEEVGEKLAEQEGICQRTVEAVQHCEAAREAALLANPINQLRHHLHAGEPCLVCGATEHPYADVVEPENEELLQDAETAFVDAKTDAQAAQDRLQALTTKRTQTEQNRQNIIEQIKDCDAKIERLRSEIAKLLTGWQEIYPNTDILSDWAAEQITNADTAMDSLREAEQAHTDALYTSQTAAQQLKTYDNDIAREKDALEKTKEELQNSTDALEDLKADIATTEDHFWELVPDTFHGVSPEDAKDQFSDKIEEVAMCKDRLTTTQNQLKLLKTNIGVDQQNLERLQKDHKQLQTEIDQYRYDGEAFLNTVREKTGELETEAEIDKALDKLEAEVQAKETERDQAEQRLQDSRSLFTQKETAHEISEKQREESGEKFDNAYKAYTHKLWDAGFDSLEAHNKAFRDETQLQKLTDQIDAHKNESQQLVLEITELRTRFDETPFDPEALGQLTAQVEEIEAQLQAKQKEVGAQEERIKGLKKALKEREALGDELHEAKQELERWQHLQETIPANALRDFALEIMFKQMGNLANEQLKYLTSERYQLEVETIGDLSVVDRWNANEKRPVETLSGGESFLTSLALALALSELSRGRAQLNSLFLDEGFGTLDTETLDIAIAALEGLRMQGRNIFLISHIQELTRRLPVKIQVNKKGNGSSSVKIQG
ncbi:MAG: AAA family ATPase [Candidatus Poribacteria bacterium]|nr:AAA family ATPase [Candidatus Poribacteria bacterium]